jgi:hypothetical protein
MQFKRGMRFTITCHQYHLLFMRLALNKGNFSPSKIQALMKVNNSWINNITLNKTAVVTKA